MGRPAVRQVVARHALAALAQAVQVWVGGLCAAASCLPRTRPPTHLVPFAPALREQDDGVDGVVGWASTGSTMANSGLYLAKQVARAPPGCCCGAPAEGKEAARAPREREGACGRGCADRDGVGGARGRVGRARGVAWGRQAIVTYPAGLVGKATGPQWLKAQHTTAYSPGSSITSQLTELLHRSAFAVG